MTIKYLSIPGGGFPQVFMNYGILKYLSKKKCINYEDIKVINATSAGALTGLIYLLNIDWKITDNFVFNRPWGDVFNINKSDILNLYYKKGLRDIDLYITSFEPLMRYVNLSTESTLLDLYNITNITFNIYTTKVNTLETVVFNHIDFPDYKIVDCIYMSCCIPGVFTPYYDISSNYTFIDGSLLVNSPFLDIFKNYKINDYELLVLDNTIDETQNAGMYCKNNKTHFDIILNYDMSYCYEIINDCTNYNFLDYDFSINDISNNTNDTNDNSFELKKDVSFLNFFIYLIKLIIYKFNKFKYNIFYIDVNKNLKKNKNVEFLYINTYHKQNRFDYNEWINVLNNKLFRYQLSIYGINLCYTVENRHKFINNLKYKFKKNDSYILIE
tara:strand:+ start:819 stop:1973 length:1155 start_codon:yes stop_codon:yes gene_type:complete